MILLWPAHNSEVLRGGRRGSLGEGGGGRVGRVPIDAAERPYDERRASLKKLNSDD